MERKRSKLPVLAVIFLGTLAALSLPPLVAGCDWAEQELPGTKSGVPVAFGATALPMHTQTRADGGATFDYWDMYVTACYTGQNNFDTGFSEVPNFMRDQWIWRSSATAPWTYSPVKYWPGAVGDKISFFAYAPASGDYAFDLDIGGFSYGEIRLGVEILASYAEDMVDIQAATALNVTRTEAVRLKFEHLTAKVSFQVLSSEEISVQNVTLSDIANSRDFYLGVSGVREDRTIYDFIESYTGHVNGSGNVPANTLTDITTFYLFSYDLMDHDMYATLSYREVGASSNIEKTVKIPIGWKRGEAVNFILKLDKIKLDIITSPGGMTWGGSTDMNMDTSENL